MHDTDQVREDRDGPDDGEGGAALLASRVEALETGLIEQDRTIHNLVAMMVDWIEAAEQARGRRP